MSGYVVIVDFRIRPSAKAAFRHLVEENAKQSCRNEPGCRRFDVVEVPDDADRILLYEIYNDKAAFDAHVKTAHFASFNKASEPHVIAKKVLACTLAYEGSTAP